MLDHGTRGERMQTTGPMYFRALVVAPAIVSIGFVASRFSIRNSGEILLISFVLAWFVFAPAMRRARRIESIHWHERVRMDAPREYNAELRRK